MTYLYLLRLSDNSLYCGVTKNPKKRIKQHKKGRGSKYVKGRLPLKLVHLEKHKNRSQALKKEAKIKKWSKEKKEKYIKKQPNHHKEPIIN